MHNSDQESSLLSFLHQSTQILRSDAPLNERLFQLFLNLSHGIPFNHFQINLFDTADESELVIKSPAVSLNDKKTFLLKRNFQYHDKKLGQLLLFMPNEFTLSKAQSQLVDILIDLITTTLLVEKKIAVNQYYSLIQERSAMARELHDSIAQSLSYLKINLSCLNMQADIVEPDTVELLQNMRKEVNTAYAQLRDLITSFKFNINQPYLLSSLEDIIKEFNQKLKLNIDLDFQLPVITANNGQFIHLLQITREALNNIYKHANATKVKVSLKKLKEDIVELIIQDNGIGLQRDWKKKEHYGLGIIQNRVDFLNGFLYIESEIKQGVTIRVNFKMQGIDHG